MSTAPLACSTCKRECVYDRCAPFGEGREAAYAVAWRCPEGHGQSLDVCPLGPLVPARELCLNCGHPYPSAEAEARCDACGLARTACPAALGLADAPADPVAVARAVFPRGLFRRGMAILNFAIQEGTDVPDVWLLKAQFLNRVGFNRSAAQMLAGAVPRFAGAAERIALLLEESFLWAECERGVEALRSADAAAALGSRSVGTHYLRGRALALLGRLEEARDEMNAVRAMDPTNADANRALGIIEASLRQKPKKRWWQFWK
ncbi:MAG: hypothetical protein U0793_09490 [Gemmataceae bacterium]